MAIFKVSEKVIQRWYRFCLNVAPFSGFKLEQCIYRLAEQTLVFFCAGRQGLVYMSVLAVSRRTMEQCDGAGS